MRLLVTGGAGFIGSHFIRYVLQTTDDVLVTNLDALTYAGNLASLADVADDPRYRFVHGDIADPALVEREVVGVDAVVNLAAESHVDRSIDDPTAFLRTNVTGAGVVFDACRKRRVPRVLHVSTDEVYGSIPAPQQASEAAPLRPSSPYAASKAAADLLAASYGTTFGYPITVTRAANTFGPYQYPEKVIPRFVTSVLDGGAVPVYGDGSQVRDWLDVRDNVAAQWLVLTAGVPGAVYNIGAGQERSNLQLARAVLARFDAGDDRIDHVTDRPGHDQRYRVATDRIHALGWRPRYLFDATIDEVVSWYRANEAWWRPLLDAGAARRQGRS